MRKGRKRQTNREAFGIAKRYTGDGFGTSGKEKGAQSSGESGGKHVGSRSGLLYDREGGGSLGETGRVGEGEGGGAAAIFSTRVNCGKRPSSLHLLWKKEKGTGLC